MELAVNQSQAAELALYKEQRLPGIHPAIPTLRPFRFSQAEICTANTVLSKLVAYV